MMNYLRSKFSMKKVDFLFIDKVNMKPVYLYIDCFGEQFMAQTAYGRRIRLSKKRKIKKK